MREGSSWVAAGSPRCDVTATVPRRLSRAGRCASARRSAAARLTEARAGPNQVETSALVAGSALVGAPAASGSCAASAAIPDSSMSRRSAAETSGSADGAVAPASRPRRPRRRSRRSRSRSLSAPVAARPPPPPPGSGSSSGSDSGSGSSSSSAPISRRSSRCSALVSDCGAQQFDGQPGGVVDGAGRADVTRGEQPAQLGQAQAGDRSGQSEGATRHGSHASTLDRPCGIPAD
mgnify:CR=1 FL=1